MANASLAEMIRQAKPNSFEPVPVGEYAAIVSAAEYKKAQTGNPYFKVEFTLQDEDVKGRKVWRNEVLSERGLGIVIGELELLGTTQEDVAAAVEEGNETGRALVCSHLIDSPCRVRVDQKEYQGRITNNVTRVLPPSEGVAPKGDPLANVSSVPAKKRGRPAAKPAEPEIEEEEEEIEEEEEEIVVAPKRTAKAAPAKAAPSKATRTRPGVPF